jgi:hypothetical protein
VRVSVCECVCVCARARVWLCIHMEKQKGDLRIGRSICLPLSHQVNQVLKRIVPLFFHFQPRLCACVYHLCMCTWTRAFMRGDTSVHACASKYVYARKGGGVWVCLTFSASSCLRMACSRKARASSSLAMASAALPR